MSYSVEYNPELRKQYPSRLKQPRKFPVKIVISLMTVVIVITVLTSGVMRIFLPGDPVVTAAAFSLLVERVSMGESVPDAVHCFFRDVITGEVTE